MTDLANDLNASSSAVATGCPECHVPLGTYQYESVVVEACPAGHGIFLTGDALQATVRSRAADRPEAEEQAALEAARPIPMDELAAAEALRTCPVDGVPMTKQVFAYESGVPIDVCQEHGIWLDAGEIDQIEAWYEAQQAQLATDRATWGGQTGRLEQIEQQHERAISEDLGNIHWGPVGWLYGKISYAWMRRDDH